MQGRSRLSKKVDRWESVLRHLGRDLSAPICELTADEIKIATRELGAQEEPRLMASIGSKLALPDFFRENGVFILPIRRGGYALVHGEGFHDLEEPGRTVDFTPSMPEKLATLNYGNGESRYLLHALHSGMIGHFSGVDRLYPTVLGKMATTDFSFRVGGSPQLSVEGAGMEIDLGLESESDVLLIEAKVQPRSTFLTRQLYYPFRTFIQVAPSKRVRPIFFVAEPSTRTYTFWEYEWKDPLNYENITLKDAARYRLPHSPLKDESLEEIESDPSLRITPQANSFDLVAGLPELVKGGVRDSKSWASRIGYDVRQGNYYSEAAEGLGLISRQRRAGNRSLQWELTEAGRRVLSASNARERDDVLAHLLLRNPVINEVFRLSRERGASGVRAADLVRIIEEKSGLGDGTPGRRASTIRSYFRWLENVTSKVHVDNNGEIFGNQAPR